ncbi:MAG: bestrophin family ion channel [Bacteroidota bacterium]
MYVKRDISFSLILLYAWKIVSLASLWSIVIFLLYFYVGWDFIKVPFQPITVIGTAVAFYLGFKNNQSYDRFWEGRKIWGAIVNYSRTWGNQVLNVITMDTVHDTTEEEVKTHKRRLIYRHVAWLHALRLQLRKPTSFSIKENTFVERFSERHNDHEEICATIAPYLSEEEVADLKKRRNIATHIVKNQGAHLRLLKERYGLMDGFDFMMMMKCLEECYNFQGKCERIKNTPFPRQYAFFSKVFVYIFTFLLPLGLLDIFDHTTTQMLPSAETFFMIPTSILITWIFLTWEAVGDNSEDPFENRPNDVPMTALTRTIEIDLRDMLDEQGLPEKIAPKDHILY